MQSKQDYGHVVLPDSTSLVVLQKHDFIQRLTLACVFIQLEAVSDFRVLKTVSKGANCCKR